MLETLKVHNLDIYTPTRWQTVILRNYGLVKIDNLANTLKCSIKRIEIEATRLGIEKITYSQLWRDKSYLTIIRNNWNLLNYEQLLSLLDMSEEQLSYNLDNNDFLGIKLGNFKPELEPIYYSKLTKEELRETHKIKKIIKKHFIDNYVSPFSFTYHKIDNPSFDNHDRIIYPYSLEYGDILLKTSHLISNEELEAYASNGVNGLWIGITLRDLCYYPFSKNKNDSYLIRRDNLNKFIKEANGKGLKIYLYLNEPRGIDVEELDPQYEYLKGRRENNLVALCISHQEVQDYLYNAIKELVTNVKNIEGIITITSSENLTHCKHIPHSDCPSCQQYHPYELAALINNIIYQAIEDCHSNTRVIANLWGWMPYCGYTLEDAKKGIDLLNKNIEVMCVSEFGTHKKGKTLYNIGEYSLSHSEPCLETISLLKHAKKGHHHVLAKIQVNNSWEMSIVPYIPCFENVYHHLDKLRKLGVYDYMLSWTLGGYPSIALSLVGSSNYDEWLKETFNDNYQIMKDIFHQISIGFSHFPFNTHLLYLSPLNHGPINLLYRNNTERKATMVTFPYDDISSWTSDRDTFISKMNKVIKYFKKSLKMLDSLNNPSKIIKEITSYLKVWTICYESTLNQYLFNIDRNDNSNKNINRYLKKELGLTLSLYKEAANNSLIGFEASNQYIYNQNMFLEKIINIYQLKKK